MMFQDTRPAQLDSTGGEDPWASFRVVQPQACLTLLREHCSVLLAGNHDLVASGTSSAEGFSRSARIAISWTSQQLTQDERAEIAAWPSATQQHGIGLAHGSMRDPAWEYVVEPDVARADVGHVEGAQLHVPHPRTRPVTREGVGG